MTCNTARSRTSRTRNCSQPAASGRTRSRRRRAPVAAAKLTDDVFYAEPATQSRRGDRGRSRGGGAGAPRRARPWPTPSSLAAPFLARGELLAARDASGAIAPRTRGELATIAADRQRLDGVHDVDAWRAAADKWRRIGEPYPEARARARLAEALLATQAPPAEIEEQLRAAAVIADALGAAPLREVIDGIASRAGVDLESAAPKSLS